MRQLKINNSITDRRSFTTEKYLQEISKIPLISLQKEIELVTRIKQGDSKAKDDLIRANLRFVVSAAKTYQNMGIELSDLINDGNIGLIKAAELFDETRGFKFISYAIWWIRQSILESMARTGRIIRLPLNKIGMLNKFKAASSILEQKHGRPASINELMDELGISENDIYELMCISAKTLHYDAPISGETSDVSQDSLIDGIKYNNQENNEFITDKLLDKKESLKIDLNRVMETLDSKEHLVLKFYYGLDNVVVKSMFEISQILGVTTERTRQIRESALKKLRVHGRAKLLQQHCN
jgi:RNA polymerase primary sigma factor